MMLPLNQSYGRRVRCPDPGCGTPSVVEPSRNRPARPGMVPPPPGSAPGGPGPPVRSDLWAIVRCPRTGSKLWPGHTPAEVIDDG